MAPTVTPASIEGLWIVELDIHEDPDRPGGSFREIWRDETFSALGIPPFSPVQWNVADSTEGTLRGFHAEPWDKLVTVLAGEVFAAVADVRHDASTIGTVWTGRLDRARALFVSRGLANGYQVTSPRATYAYLVNGRWDPTMRYPAVAWDDPDLAVGWPITDERLSLSAKDRANPTLRELRG
jgi:dTDP-4-dehydrorhamnose 3,5-epimerase/reductase